MKKYRDLERMIKAYADAQTPDRYDQLSHRTPSPGDSMVIPLPVRRKRIVEKAVGIAACLALLGGGLWVTTQMQGRLSLTADSLSTGSAGASSEAAQAVEDDAAPQEAPEEGSTAEEPQYQVALASPEAGEEETAAQENGDDAGFEEPVEEVVRENPVTGGGVVASAGYAQETEAVSEETEEAESLVLVPLEEVTDELAAEGIEAEEEASQESQTLEMRSVFHVFSAGVSSSEQVVGETSVLRGQLTAVTAPQITQTSASPVLPQGAQETAEDLEASLQEVYYETGVQMLEPGWLPQGMELQQVHLSSGDEPEDRRKGTLIYGDTQGPYQGTGEGEQWFSVSVEKKHREYLTAEWLPENLLDLGDGLKIRLTQIQGDSQTSDWKGELIYSGFFYQMVGRGMDQDVFLEVVRSVFLS